MSVTGWGGVTLTVELDLSQSIGPAGGVTPYDTALWGLGVWGTDLWGAGPVWTDITASVLGLETSHGFSYELDAYQVGRLNLTLDNTSGDFSPDNPSSPYRLFGETTIAPLRKIRVTGSYAGIEFPLFFGRLDSWDEQFHGQEGGSVAVSALDIFADLAAWIGQPTALVGAGETYGNRVARILDAAGWKGARSIDTGRTTVQATTLAGSATSLLATASAAEGGVVWADASGMIVAEGRNSLIEKTRSNTTQITFANRDDDTALLYEADGINPSYDATLVKNYANYTREGGTAQVYSAQTSRDLFGDRVDSVTGLANDTDDDVAILARRAIGLNNYPERRVESLRFQPMRQPTQARTDLAWSLIAGQALALRSLVRLEHLTPQGFELNRWLFIRGCTHRITPTDWSVDLTFTSATVWHSLADSRWGAATWGQSAWSW